MTTIDDLANLIRPATPRRKVVRLPSLNDRVTINGRTGSGKTVMGTWLLSQARFDLQPFIVIDFKEEGLFRKIRRIQPIEIGDMLPTKPGLYHLAPIRAEYDQLEDWLWKIWTAGKTGLFVDEGYLLPDKHAWRALLVTGRSRRIPLYTLSQRPVRLPRFTISETNFYAAFHLNDRRDRKVVGEFVPDNHVWDMDKRLPPFHFRWYGVDDDFSCIGSPSPDMDTILETFERRLRPRQTML